MNACKEHLVLCNSEIEFLNGKHCRCTFRSWGFCKELARAHADKHLISECVFVACIFKCTHSENEFVNGTYCRCTFRSWGFCKELARMHDIQHYLSETLIVGCWCSRKVFESMKNNSQSAFFERWRLPETQISLNMFKHL